jgi:hypothetical protein
MAMERSPQQRNLLQAKREILRGNATFLEAM